MKKRTFSSQGCHFLENEKIHRWGKFLRKNIYMRVPFHDQEIPRWGLFNFSFCESYLAHYGVIKRNYCRIKMFTHLHALIPSICNADHKEIDWLFYFFSLSMEYSQVWNKLDCVWFFDILWRTYVDPLNHCIRFFFTFCSFALRLIAINVLVDSIVSLSFGTYDCVQISSNFCASQFLCHSIY